MVGLGGNLIGALVPSVKAITKHATRYGYPPNVVFLLSLKKGKKKQRKELQRELSSAGVRYWIRTLF